MSHQLAPGAAASPLEAAMAAAAAAGCAPFPNPALALVASAGGGAAPCVEVTQAHVDALDAAGTGLPVWHDAVAVSRELDPAASLLSVARVLCDARVPAVAGHVLSLQQMGGVAMRHAVCYAPTPLVVAGWYALDYLGASPALLQPTLSALVCAQLVGAAVELHDAPDGPLPRALAAQQAALVEIAAAVFEVPHAALAGDAAAARAAALWALALGLEDVGVGGTALTGAPTHVGPHRLAYHAAAAGAGVVPLVELAAASHVWPAEGGAAEVLRACARHGRTDAFKAVASGGVALPGPAAAVDLGTHGALAAYGGYTALLAWVAASVGDPEAAAARAGAPASALQAAWRDVLQAALHGGHAGVLDWLHARRAVTTGTDSKRTERVRLTTMALRDGAVSPSVMATGNTGGWTWLEARRLLCRTPMSLHLPAAALRPASCVLRVAAWLAARSRLQRIVFMYGEAWAALAGAPGAYLQHIWPVMEWQVQRGFVVPADMGADVDRLTAAEAGALAAALSLVRGGAPLSPAAATAFVRKGTAAQLAELAAVGADLGNNALEQAVLAHNTDTLSWLAARVDWTPEAAKKAMRIAVGNDVPAALAVLVSASGVAPSTAIVEHAINCGSLHVVEWCAARLPYDEAYLPLAEYKASRFGPPRAGMPERRAIFKVVRAWAQSSAVAVPPE